MEQVGGNAVGRLNGQKKDDHSEARRDFRTGVNIGWFGGQDTSSMVSRFLHVLIRAAGATD